MAEPARDGRSLSGAIRLTWWGPYIGAPFVDGGRGPEFYDCWGLVTAVYATHRGIELPAYGEISAHDLGRVSRAMAGYRDGWQQVETPEPFDVALMRLPLSARPGHVGIYVGDGMILHIEAKARAALESVKSVMIAERIIGYWRHE